MTLVEDQTHKKNKNTKIVCFEELYKQHHAPVYRFAYYLTQKREEADEIYQETWLRVVKSFHKIDQVRVIQSWLFTIVANIHRDRLRKKQIRKIVSHNHIPDETNSPSIREKKAAVPPSVGKYESNAVDFQLAFEKALSELPPRQKQVFVLKEMEGYKIREISSVLKIPQGTVKSLLHRSVKRLRGTLSDYNS